MNGQEHTLEEPVIESNSDTPSISKEISHGWSEMSKANGNKPHEDHKRKTDTKMSDFIKPPDSFNSKIFINWENDANVCWLDASMAILVHNQTMRRFIEKNPDSQVCKMINIYDNAMRTLNDFNESMEERIKIARRKLHEVQESSLKYLQPILKYRKGEPDSAFCSLYNLITEGKSIREYFDVTYSWIRQCENCETQRVLNIKKPIITMAKVNKFEPNNPISLCQCPLCKKLDQKMTLVYKTLPECLIFHFENGGGDGDSPPLNFVVESRKYELTGVMTLEKSHDSTVNHFVSWIRDPVDNTWLECNDLNMDIVLFSSDLPEFNLKDVYIYAYEALDNLGTLGVIDNLSNSSIFSEEIGNSSINIPCIDISDESDDLKNISSDNSILENKHCSESEENIENIKAFLSCTKKDLDKKSTVNEAVMSEQNQLKDLPKNILKNNSCEKNMFELKDGASVLNLEIKSSAVPDALKTGKSMKVSENKSHPKESMLKSEKKVVSGSKEIKLSNMSEKVACMQNVETTSKMVTANTVMDVNKWIKEKINRTKLRKNRFAEDNTNKRFVPIRSIEKKGNVFHKVPLNTEKFHESSTFDKAKGEELEWENSDETDALNPKRNIDKELQNSQSKINRIVELVHDKKCDNKDEIFLKPGVPSKHEKYMIDDNEKNSGASLIESILEPNHLSHLLVETFVNYETIGACEEENIIRSSTDREEFLVSNKSLEDKLSEIKQPSKTVSKVAITKKNNPAKKDKPLNSKEEKQCDVNDSKHQECDKRVIAKENLTVVRKALPDENKTQIGNKKGENMDSNQHLVKKNTKYTCQEEEHATFKEKAVKLAHNLGALSVKKRKYSKECSISETKDIEMGPYQNEFLMKAQKSSDPLIMFEIEGSNPSVSSSLLKLKGVTQVEKVSKRYKTSDDKLLRIKEAQHQINEHESEESNDSISANTSDRSKLNGEATRLSKKHKAHDDKLLLRMKQVSLKEARQQMKEHESEESNHSVSSNVLNHFEDTKIEKLSKKHKTSDDKLLQRMKQTSFKEGKYEIKRHRPEVTDSSKNEDAIMSVPSTSYAHTVSGSIEQHESCNSYTSRFNQMLNGEVLKRDSVECKNIPSDFTKDDSPIKMRKKKKTPNFYNYRLCPKENCPCVNAGIDEVVDAGVDYFFAKIMQHFKSEFPEGYIN